MMRRTAFFACLVALGCSSTKDGATTAASSMPCDVDEVVAKRCRSCHAEKPKYGAPMPLVTGADVHATAKSDGTTPVFEMMKKRLHDAQRPMPPTGMLPANELAVLDGWLASGATTSAASCVTSDAGAPPVIGPEALPCPASQQTKFLAHGDGGKFAVPADAGNLYQCFTFKSPFKSGVQATDFAPVIDDARVVHHWILFETTTPQTDGGFGPCNMPFDATFVQGWAPGKGNVALPKDVGMKLPGEDRWLILQLHYWNVAGYSDSKDASGVAMCTTDVPRAHEAAVSTLGSLDIAIPPKTSGHTVVGDCTPELTEDVHLIGTGPHMHRHGRSLKTEVLRAGGSVDVAVDVPNFDFNTQDSYPSDLVIHPGDKLRTTCTYDNPDSSTIYFGERTEDEMCFDFVLAWPSTGLVNSGGKAAKRCIDPK
ncbi:MAG: monooxygenase [Polyangiales bacterium]